MLSGRGRVGGCELPGMSSFPQCLTQGFQTCDKQHLTRAFTSSFDVSHSGTPHSSSEGLHLSVSCQQMK